MRRWKVGIVGGGPGGLFAAYHLQKFATEPFSATIFEASSRLGGKILTKQFQHATATYEAGAAELYDYTPVAEDALKELVAELGLPTTAMRGSSVIIKERTLANLEDIREHLGEAAHNAIISFDSDARGHINPQEFYYSDESHRAATQPAPRFDTYIARVREPAAREYLETLIHSDLATEPAKTNVVYGLHNYLMNDATYMQLYSISGGNERLTQELAARIEAEKRLEHTVVRIEKNDTGRYVVTSQHDLIIKQDEFDYVVIALPNTYLPTIEFAGERLSIAIASHHAHYNHPAHYLRITALFREPFWRSAFTESYCMLDRFGGCCLYDESSREPESRNHVLGWLIGGEAAQTMSEWDDEKLIATALDSFPASLKWGRELFLEAQVHRWVSAVSAMPGGEFHLTLDKRHQPEPLEHANLFLVGDYLFDSTLNGVLDSAEYVAAWIAGNMSERHGASL